MPLDVEHSGFERYLRAYRADYDDLTARVAREIVARVTNHDTVSRDTLAEVLTEPKAVIAHILERLDMAGKIEADTPA